MTTTIRSVTTCHKDGWLDYGRECLKGWKNWPANAELRWYTEGYDIPETPRVTAVPIGRLRGLSGFKRRYGDYRPPSFLWDVVKFSHKVFAAVDALRDWNGIGVWLDADCITHAKIPDGFIEELLGDAYMAIFKRPGLYTETGFWVMNCSHEAHKDFLAMWARWYEGDGFKTLANWTDCETLDATLRKFIKDGRIGVRNLSPEKCPDGHPQAHSVVAPYIDHRKGERKKLSASPENKFSSGRK